MRYVMALLAAASLLGTLAGVSPAYAQANKHHPAKKTAAKMMYECKMDHTKSAKPGKCPKCGMAMTKMAGMDHSKMSKAEHAKLMYECNMDGAKSAKPGNCPKCGMKMTAMKMGGKSKK